TIPHGPYEHYRAPATEEPPLRMAPPDALNLLYFGVIRPYKGLEDLVAAFDAIPEPEIEGYWLTVVGETWEGWTLPAERITTSRYSNRISFVNRYVHDRELDGFLRGADSIVLPYRRSSISGPLHVAMAYGLPIVMTDVGGNTEAAQGYEGLVLVPPADAPALTRALRGLHAMRGVRSHRDHSWQHVADGYEILFQKVKGEVPASHTTIGSARLDFG
ncbi:MAG: glycosyltransferase, partial [Gemmatimonadaceae bacterium]|nr:glycosyltransferase [Gemmatimonadaceae bacterium]